MNPLFVNLPFNERIVQALCWTLVHSLWQGLLLAIVTGLAILLTRRSGPIIRYILFSTLFFLFFLGSCLTFSLQWDRTGAPVHTGAWIGMQDQGLTGMSSRKGIDQATVLPVVQGMIGKMVNYLNEHAALIVAIWLLVFSARLVKISAQLGAQQRLRHYRAHQTSAYWKDRLGDLARQLGIRTPVMLMESEIVSVPMVTGFLKPIILLPFSCLTQLSPSQVEAILLHELAHIRRKDYFVNLIQSLAELLFFFNPGVWWICSLIRQERENCCDDIAVGQAGSKKEFISALVSFQAYDRKSERYAIAFPGSDNHLLQRVQRIVYRDNKTLDGREKFFLVCCFLISGALMLAFTHVPQVNPATGLHRSRRDAFVIPQGIGVRVAVDSAGPVDDPAPLNSAAPTPAQAKAESKEQPEKVEMKEKKEKKDKKEIKEREKMEVKEQKEKAEMKEQQEKAEMKDQQDQAEIKEQDESSAQQDRVEERKKRIAQQIRVRQEQKRIEENDQRIKEENQRTQEENQRIGAEDQQVQAENQRVEEENKRLAQEDRRIAAESKRIEEEGSRVAGERERIQEEKMRVAAQQLFLEDQKCKGAAGKKVRPIKPKIPIAPMEKDSSGSSSLNRSPAPEI